MPVGNKQNLAPSPDASQEQRIIEQSMQYFENVQRVTKGAENWKLARSYGHGDFYFVKLGFGIPGTQNYEQHHGIITRVAGRMAWEPEHVLMLADGTVTDVLMNVSGDVTVPRAIGLNCLPDKLGNRYPLHEAVAKQVREHADQSTRPLDQAMVSMYHYDQSMWYSQGETTGEVNGTPIGVHISASNLWRKEWVDERQQALNALEQEFNNAQQSATAPPLQQPN